MFALRRLSAILVILALLLAPLTAQARPSAQTVDPAALAAALLPSLTPEERVGQLFLIHFSGSQVPGDSVLAELIARYHIGGVVLRADQDNIPPGAAPGDVLALANQIQELDWEASQQTRIDAQTSLEVRSTFVPLFIGIQQSGDGLPNDQLTTQITRLPSQMAIGATWDPEMARQVGSVLGQELSALGINLLLGPSLDVLANPQRDGTQDLGTRTFGGDPFWVSQMGQAYVAGLHAGSSSQLAVVASHFPGYGASDRLPEAEVATVRKTLAELQAFDLMPFFAVTGSAPSPEATADGLLASHIRFQGFQGNFRTTTRPVSLDPAALGTLMSLPQIASWRGAGGLLVSDDLGGQSIRRFYELTSQPYEAWRVTRNALLAGSDLLYVSDFTSFTDPEPYTATARTLENFSQKYREDSAFAQRVDEAVLRILTLKYRLVGDFSLGSVARSAGNLAALGGAAQMTFEVARQSATLLSPSASDLENLIPDPPNQNDRIVFITDARQVKACLQCAAEPLLSENALENVILRLYGPQAGGLILRNNLVSYSLDDLNELLNSPTNQPDLENDLNRAHWIVFSMLDNSSQFPSFDVLDRFLSERPDLFQQARLVVFGFNAPYFLDATNIAKLTAYYGLYSKAPPFVDMAAYLLFQELDSPGVSPVSVAGINYDLNQAVFPDPAQPIVLEVDLPAAPGGIETTPAPLPEFRVGESIPLRTGVILDHNGHPVPDDTPVEFTFSLAGDPNSVRHTEYTRGGIARTSYLTQQPGNLQVTAQSNLALSAPLSLVVQTASGEPPPTLPPPTPTLTPPPPTPTPTPTLAPLPGQATPEPPRSQIIFGDWLMALLVTGGIGWVVYRLAALIGQVRWGVRAGFLSLIGGLVGYFYLLLQLPGADRFMSGSISRGIFLGALSGSLLGLFITWLWRSLNQGGRHAGQGD